MKCFEKKQKASPNRSDISRSSLVALPGFMFKATQEDGQEARHLKNMLMEGTVLVVFQSEEL